MITGVRLIRCVAVVFVTLGLTAAAGAATIEDTFTRSDGTALGDTEIGSFSWLEYDTVGTTGDTADLIGGELRLTGFAGAGSNDPAQAILEASMADLDISADFRFGGLLNPTTGSTYNTGGFMLRKPSTAAGIAGPSSIGQIDVGMLPGGGFLIRQGSGVGNPTVYYNDTPFPGGSANNNFSPAGMLPASIGGLPFDADQDGVLEETEPFRLGASLVGDQLTMKVNSVPLFSVGLPTSGPAGPTSYMSLYKNRYTSTGTRNAADPMFDNVEINGTLLVPPPAGSFRDSFGRVDSTNLNPAEVSGFSWFERDTQGVTLDVARIVGGELHVHGSGGGTLPPTTHNHGEAVVDVDLADVVVSADMRFVLNNTTGPDTANSGGFMLRKSAVGTSIGASPLLGVEMYPTGAFLVRETPGPGVLTWVIAGNPFNGVTGWPAVKDFQGAGSLPTAIGGAPFDANGNGRLEADEPFNLAARVIDKRIQIFINGQHIMSGSLNSTGSAVNYVSMLKNRATSAGATIADSFFDNISIDPAQPNIVLSHHDDRSPSTFEGWTSFVAGSVAHNGPIDDGGIPAWNIDDNGGGNRAALTTTLTQDELDAVTEYGYRMRARMKVLDVGDSPDGAVEMGVFAGSTTGHFLWFGSDGDGNPTVMGVTGVPGGVPVGPSATISGSGYHDYEMVYDPDTQLVDVFVDGDPTPVIAGYTGFASSISNRVLWGSNAGGGVGESNWTFVEFAVPEPSTLVLMMLGLLGPAVCGRRRRK